MKEIGAQCADEVRELLINEYGIKVVDLIVLRIFIYHPKTMLSHVPLNVIEVIEGAVSDDLPVTGSSNPDLVQAHKPLWIINHYGEFPQGLIVPLRLWGFPQHQ